MPRIKRQLRYDDWVAHEDRPGVHGRVVSSVTNGWVIIEWRYDKRVTSEMADKLMRVMEGRGKDDG